jgi:hypothetical protein
MSDIDHFLRQFHAAADIDPSRTNRQLIELVLACFRNRTHRMAVAHAPRNSGVTTTLIALAKWYKQLSPNVWPLLVTSSLGVYRDNSIDTVSWRQSILGVRPRPTFVLIDSPLSVEDQRSVATTKRYEQWLFKLPFPCIEVIQSPKLSDIHR